MSKAVLLLAVPAIAALAAWNLALSSEISDLRAELGANAGAAPAGSAAKSAGSSSAAAGGESRPRESSRANLQVTDLQERVASLEKSLAAAQERAAGVSGAADSTEAALASPVYSSDEFRSAVDKVIEDREEAKRIDRMRKQAETMAKMWLRETDVSADQTKQVVDIVFASLQKQQAIRDDLTLTDDQRRADLNSLEQGRHDQIAGVLSAQQMEVVGPRLTTRFRRGDAPVTVDPAIQEKVRRLQEQGRARRQNGQGGQPATPPKDE